jgi:pimeloyl-ACP methyl ester carboxylesterase
MPKTAKAQPPATPVRVRRGYFECRFGQLHVHNTMPPGGGFEEGTPLLCIHDVSGTGRSFAPLMSLAGRDRSAYAPDLPGLGESDPPGADAPSLTDYAGALGDFLDAMRLRRLDIVANRTGALVATELATLRSEQIGRLVFISVPVPAAAPARAAPEAERLSPAQHRFQEALAAYPARERLARLTQKLLVVRPRDDLWDATARIRDVLSAARVVDLEAPGGELLACAPEHLLACIRDFLRD